MKITQVISGAWPEAKLSPPPPPLPADSVEDEFELSTVSHRPEGLEQLQEQTKFTRKELQVLYRGFKNVSGGRSQLGKGCPRQAWLTCSCLAWRVWPGCFEEGDGAHRPNEVQGPWGWRAGPVT